MILELQQQLQQLKGHGQHAMISALYGDSQTWHQVERLQAQLQLLQQQVQQQQPRYWQVQSWDASASDWWAWPGARWQQQASASDWQQQAGSSTTGAKAGRSDVMLWSSLW